jgi:hypothetical protein
VVSNIVRFDKLRSQDNASLSPTYTALGFSTTPTTPAPFTHAMRLLHFTNTTDANLIISFDAINDNIIIPADTFSLYDLTGNQDQNESFRYQNGSQLYVKYESAPPTTGSLYVTAVYGLGE